MRQRSTVVLLPGLLCDDDIWRPQIERLGQDYEIFCPGFMDRPTIGAMAEDILARAPNRFALAGHSMGGTTSLLAAAAEPQRVRALALFDPVIFPAEAQGSGGSPESPLVGGALRRRATFPNKDAAFQAYRGRGAFKTWSDEQLADYVAAGFLETRNGEVTLACTPQWEASNFRTHNYDPWKAFAESRCPIRVLRADIASTFRLEGREAEFARLGSRATIETIPGASHFLPMERPELVRATLSACAAL